MQTQHKIQQKSKNNQTNKQETVHTNGKTDSNYYDSKSKYEIDEELLNINQP